MNKNKNKTLKETKIPEQDLEKISGGGAHVVERPHIAEVHVFHQEEHGSAPRRAPPKAAPSTELFQNELGGPNIEYHLAAPGKPLPKPDHFVSGQKDDARASWSKAKAPTAKEFRDGARTNEAVRTWAKAAEQKEVGSLADFAGAQPQERAGEAAPQEKSKKSWFSWLPSFKLPSLPSFKGFSFKGLLGRAFGSGKKEAPAPLGQREKEDFQDRLIQALQKRTTNVHDRRTGDIYVTDPVLGDLQKRATNKEIAQIEKVAFEAHEELLRQKNAAVESPAVEAPVEQPVERAEVSANTAVTPSQPQTEKEALITDFRAQLREGLEDLVEPFVPATPETKSRFKNAGRFSRDGDLGMAYDGMPGLEEKIDQAILDKKITRAEVTQIENQLLTEKNQAHFKNV